MAKKIKYPHASFLKTVTGLPGHWFVHKRIYKHKNTPIDFYNAKDHYSSLHISDGLTGVYHVNYKGTGLKVFKNRTTALKFAKQYMKKNKL